MSVPATPDKRMTVPEFLAWAARQPETARYELVDGRVVTMAAERLRHNLAKGAAYRALQDAVRAAGLPCTVFTDGVGVATGDRGVRVPDASVQCGVEIDLDAPHIDAPVVVVEVTSPSSDRQDSGVKLIEYFSIPSVVHYLIVLPENRRVVHHRRGEGADIATRILRDHETISLEPPGMTVTVADLLGPTSPDAEEALS